MTNVQFQGNTPQEYLNTPLKYIVQIQGTRFDPLLNASTNQTIQPEPSMTVGEVKELTKHQRFDVTALVKEVREPRKVTDTRSVVDIIIMDESAQHYTVQELKWSYWTDTPPNADQCATIGILRESEVSRTPLSFFALDGKKTDRGYKV